MDKKYISLVSDSMPISSRNLINSVNSHKSTQVSKKSEYKIAQSEIRHYMDKYCNDEVLFSGTLVKKETLQKMYSPYLMDYGMGVVVCESSSENKTVLHGGNIQGFSSYISMNLLKEYTIIILTNRENFFDIDNLGTTLTTILNKAL